MRRLLIPAAALLAACDIIGPKEPAFLFETDSPEYEAGDVVEATLRNAHGGRRRFELCALLEVSFPGGIWAVPPGAAGPDECPPGSGQLGPGDYRILRLQLPASLPPGRYHWRLSNPANTTTNVFTVVASQ